MDGSIERVRAVIMGELPDRPPLYDLLRNDSVINYFTGETLSIENASEVVFKAYEPAIDATRPLVRLPNDERTERLPDGRQQRFFRWTIWTGHVAYPDTDAYAQAKRAYLDAFDPGWTAEKEEDLTAFLQSVADHRRRLGEIFFFPGAPSIGIMGIYGEVGIEQFTYALAEYPDLIEELLEVRMESALVWLDHLPDDHGIEAVFIGDDIAFKSGPLLSPQWFDDHYFHRFARVLARYHERGIKVLFHSDGNLNSLLPGLVESGIDGLNPIEVLAGMDVEDIHRKYPRLFLCGAIDVSQLLPYGTPAEIREAVRRSIEAAEGRLMVGSSTELHNEVPLENFLAMRDTALEYTYR